jgi:hypothetical protein
VGFLFALRLLVLYLFIFIQSAKKTPIPMWLVKLKTIYKKNLQAIPVGGLSPCNTPG